MLAFANFKLIVAAPRLVSGGRAGLKFEIFKLFLTLGVRIYRKGLGLISLILHRLGAGLRRTSILLFAPILRRRRRRRVLPEARQFY